MRVAIVGGGIGSITTALLLSNQGIEVTIYEKDAKLGGRLSFVEKDGFRIDKGPTIVLLPEMIQSILKEAGVDASSYELIPCDPLYQIHFSDGTLYTKYADKAMQRKEIAQKFPEDLEGFERFMGDMDVRFRLGKANFLEKPFLSFTDFWNYRTIGLLGKLKAYRSVYKQLETYFQSEKLRIAYALQTLYVGGNPLTSPAIYSLVSFSEHQHGIYYVKGGYASLVETLEKELRGRNVTIRTGADVEEVVTDGHRAIGIRVNGQVQSYDAYVLNGDFPVAESQLMKKEKRYTASSACLLLYFGLDKFYDNAMTHQFYIGENFVQSMNEIFKEHKVPTSPSYYTFYPSSIDKSLAPVGKSVLYTLVPVPSGDSIDWSKEGPELTEQIINRMEQDGFPGLRNHIEWMQLRTPEDARKEGLYMGGSFGIAPELLQSGIFRPQLKPFNEDNVFAVGASTHPGGGVPIVMQGAKLVSDYVVDNQLTIKEMDVVEIG